MTSKQRGGKQLFASNVKTVTIPSMKLQHSYDWTRSFKLLYEKAKKEYQSGNRDFERFFTRPEVKWLESIGCTAMQLYDFAEDYPELDWETALLITAARRDYFLHVQNGITSKKIIPVDDFPAKNAMLNDIPWLPRIILKAKARLRGELPKELMYCCGGDRQFLNKFDIHPADFLRIVWSAGNDDDKVVSFVESRPMQKNL